MNNSEHQPNHYPHGENPYAPRRQITPESPGSGTPSAEHAQHQPNPYGNNTQQPHPAAQAYPQQQPYVQPQPYRQQAPQQQQTPPPQQQYQPDTQQQDPNHHDHRPPEPVHVPKQGFWARLFGRKPARTAPPRKYGPLVSQEELIRTLDAPLYGHRITVSSLKGGVGKTTSVVGLGTALAIHRRDTVTALDANPHRGNLSERLGEEHLTTVRNLLENLETIRSVSDYRRFTSQSRARFEVIASEKDPDKQKGFTRADYEQVLQVMLTFRSMVITDTGIDLTLDLMNSVYEMTDSLVIATTIAADSRKLAEETLNWWETHAPNGRDLIDDAVVIVARVVPFTLPDDVDTVSGDELRRLRTEFELQQQNAEDEVRQAFGHRVRSIVYIPYDPSLKGGGVFEWEQLRSDTQQAFLNAAYEVAKSFR